MDKIYRPGQNLNEIDKLNFTISPSPEITGNLQLVNEKIEGSVQNVIPIPEHEDYFKNKILQWVVGQNNGLSDIVDRTIMVNGHKNLLFKSGFQCTIEDANNNMLPVEYASAYVPQLQAIMDTQNEINSSNFLTTSINNIKNTNNINNQTPQTNTQISPIAQLLKKRKKTETKLYIEVILDLPSQILYDMLIDEFETSNDEIISECLNDENLQIIKTQIKEAITKYYKGRK